MLTRTLLLLPLLLGIAVAGNDPEPDLTPRAPADRSADIAATVNDESISVGTVKEMVDEVLQGRPVNAAALARIQAEVLSQLIDRTLILQMLKRSGKALPETAISLAIEEVKKQAKAQKVDFARMLADRKLSEQQFRNQLVWQLNWAKLAQAELTDSVLKAYFEAHKHEYDGSEMRVRHILMRPDGNGRLKETERLKQQVGKLRSLIESGTFSFEDAAKKYSAGPSRRKGGDLGFIPRNGLMLEAFSAAAFKLEQGQLSEPVVTPYGVHLIQVTEVKPGRRLWIEAKEQLRAPAAQERLEKLAAKERAQANVTFTGKIPYFRPGTRELAVEPTAE
jgi:peptidyl-prolyl cis-trans isomerase C